MKTALLISCGLSSQLLLQLLCQHCSPAASNSVTRHRILLPSLPFFFTFSQHMSFYTRPGLQTSRPLPTRHAHRQQAISGSVVIGTHAHPHWRACTAACSQHLTLSFNNHRTFVSPRVKMSSTPTAATDVARAVAEARAKAETLANVGSWALSGAAIAVY